MLNCLQSGQTAVLLSALLSWALVACSPTIPLERIVAQYQADRAYPALSIRSPQEDTLFPPGLAPPTFVWDQNGRKADAWIILIQGQPTAKSHAFLSTKTEWTPPAIEWETIKGLSKAQPLKVTVLEFNTSSPLNILSRGQVLIRTSTDPVGAPIFYREVNLPFKEAIKDPSQIRWRFGSIDSQQPPPVVLEHLPVCGNCHSFSAEGRTLGMDVDYANNKGSYVLTRVEKKMALASSDIFAWDDYQKEDHQQTFGLLSQVSPDGRRVVSTVRDKSVFVAKPDLAFSQLFFPIKGILVAHERNTGAFKSLPGADDPEFVQSNPAWSPDGREIVFARTKAYQLKSQDAQGKMLLSEEDCAEFLREGKEFQFDLYRVPYNGGQGGKAEPVAGASRNGKSNFFPKYSPDGKWIVFCQARSFMLLQPDSELYIIPAAGGEARRLKCNTARMNSWHSWAPNSRWLVFSSKANSPYTQLFLTHIDEQGKSTPAVLLERFTVPDRAANIPEFVNAPAGAIERIQERFLDDNSLSRAAYLLEVNGDIDQAITKYQQALAINPRNVHAHQRLGFLLFHQKRQFKEGLAHTTEALQLDPNEGCAHYDLGMALQYAGQIEPAVEHFEAAVRLLPAGFDRRYNPADMRCSLGNVLIAKGDFAEATAVLTSAVALKPTNAPTHYLLALALAAQDRVAEALPLYRVALQAQPSLDTSADLHRLFAAHFAKMGLLREALTSAQKAQQLARAAGDTALVEEIAQQVEDYRAASGPRQSGD